MSAPKVLDRRIRALHRRRRPLLTKLYTAGLTPREEMRLRVGDERLGKLEMIQVYGTIYPPDPPVFAMLEALQKKIDGALAEFGSISESGEEEKR